MAPAASSSLLQPLSLAGTTLRNRLGLGPINPGFFEPDGSATPSICEFYQEYARAGVGLVYLGGVAVSQSGRANASSLVVASSGARAGIEAVAQVVHDYGGVLAVQLMHSGRQASSSEIGTRLVAASPIACPVYRELPVQAGARDIRQFVRWFRDGARSVSEAGADLIEVHAAHGYLLSGFLSRSSNRRADAYGGSVANRFRLLHQIVDAIRDVTDIGLGVRVNAAENGSGDGLTIDELIEGLYPIVSALAFVSVTGGVYTQSQDWIIPRREMGPALWKQQSELLRRMLERPVFLAGNIHNVQLAEDVLSAGTADVALMVRSLLADPWLLPKWIEGRHREAQPCTELYLCKYHSRGLRHVYCPHNPTLRRLLRRPLGTPAREHVDRA